MESSQSNFQPSPEGPPPIAPSPPPSQSDNSSTRKKFHTAAFVAVVVGICLLVGGGVYAYFFYYRSPEKIFERAVSNLSDVRTVSYDGAITATMKLDTADSASLGFDESLVLNMIVSGSSDVSDPEHKKSIGTITLSMPIPLVGNMSLSLDTITIDTITFAKLNDASTLGFFSALLPLEEGWVRIDPQEISAALDQEGISLEDKTAVLQRALEGGFSPLRFERIQHIAQEAKVVHITETLNDGQVDGQPAHHYAYTLDMRALRGLFSRILQERNAEHSFSPQEQQELEREIEEFGENSAAHGELWIGTKDELPLKFTLDISINDADTGEQTAVIGIAMNYYGYNEPVSIRTPDESKNIMDVINGISTLFREPPDGDDPLLFEDGTASPIPARQNNISIDSDGDGLPDEHEELLGTDPTNRDTDEDGYSDYEEIRNGFNPKGAGGF